MKPPDHEPPLPGELDQLQPGGLDQSPPGGFVQSPPELHQGANLKWAVPPLCRSRGTSSIVR